MSDVKINLKLLTKSFTDGMDKVNKSVSTTNLAIGNMVGSLAADTLKAFASTSITAFASIFNGAKNLEQTTKLFETLTGSMFDAKKLVEELQTAAARTPFELEGLQSATTQLLTLKEITSDNVIPALMQLGDIASVGANDLDGLTRAFVKVQSEGRVTAETLDSLMNQSPLLGQAMVQAAGLSGMGALRKAMGEGKVSADVLDIAIKQLTTKGGKAFNAMAGQSATLGGQISNLEDTFTNLASAIGMDLLPIFKDIVSAFANLIESNKEFIKNSAVAAIGLLGDVTKGTLDIIKSGIDIYRSNKIGIDLFIGAIAAAGAALVIFQGITIAWAATSVASFSSVATSAGAMWAAITAPITLVTAAVAAVGVGLFFMVKEWDEVVTSFQRGEVYLSAIWTNIGNDVTQMVSSVKISLIDMMLNASIFGKSLVSSGMKEYLLKIKQESIEASKAASIHQKAEDNRVKGLIQGINDELKARQDAAALKQAIADGTLVTVLAETEAERTSREDKEKIAATAEANRLEAKGTFDTTLLDMDTVFREEIALRNALDKEIEAMSSAERLKFLKKHLGAVAAQKTIAEANALAARSKFDEANAVLDKAMKDAKAKSLETDVKNVKVAEQEKAKILLTSQETTLKDLDKAQANKLISEKDYEKKSKEIKQKAVDDAKKLNDIEVANNKLMLTGISGILGNLSTLQQSKSREAFKVGKAAALAQAGVDTYVGASGAFAAMAGIPVVGPGLGIAAAAAAVIAGGMRVQAIESQKFASGGIVAGTSFAGDNVNAKVNSSEMILNKSQQTSLFNMANGGGGNSNKMVEAIESLGNRIANMEITLVASDEAIARSASRGVQEGIVIGESR